MGVVKVTCPIFKFWAPHISGTADQVKIDTSTLVSRFIKVSNRECMIEYFRTRMWANAKRDGRPVEHRWRPLFNAAKYGRTSNLRPLRLGEEKKKIERNNRAKI